jgi:AraC-like DNA-binding protein
MLREQDGTPEGLRTIIRDYVIPALERTNAPRLVILPAGLSVEERLAGKDIEQHQFHEICVCLRGRAEMWVGSEIVICEESQVVVIPSGIPHSAASLHCVVSAPEDVFSRLLWVSIFPFGSLLSLCESAYGVHRSAPRQLFLNHHSQICVEHALIALQEARDGAELMVKYLLLQMMVAILQGQAVHSSGLIEQESQPGEIPAERTLRLSDKVVEYVRRHYFLTELGLDLVSRAVGANKSHVSKQFRLETGATITEYINRVRIDAAKRLLMAGLKVSVVAEFVGFSDPYYFSRVFARVMKCSPTEYRRRGECLPASPSGRPRKSANV